MFQSFTAPGHPAHSTHSTRFTRCRFSGYTAIALLASSLLAAPCMAAAGGANKEDAVAMVKKGVAFIKANSAEKGYAEISNKSPQFIKEDLYLVVYGLDGTVLAHGANTKMVGKNLIDFKDVDGKAFVKERVETAKTKNSFWQDYKFTNPENKKIEPKTMYCERLNETVVCGGIYL
jgi:signal transduction histidine kinase